MRILVVGGTGVLGRQVVPRLIERGHAVRVVVRRQAQAGMVEAAGAEAVAGDILDHESLVTAAAGCEAAIHIATAIPRGPEGNWGINDRIRREGTAQPARRRNRQRCAPLCAAEHRHAVWRHRVDVVDESAPLRPTPVIQSAADMEQMVRQSTLDWCILRGGMFYGAGAGLEEDGGRRRGRVN